jgi:hypothetical protein
LEEDNWSLRSPEVQLTIEVENMEEDNWSMKNPEVQLTIELEIGRRQLQSVKTEVQMQLNLTAWASWWLLPIAKNSQICKKMLEGGRKWRKKRQEEGSQNSSIDSVNSGSEPDYQIYKPLGWAPWWG